LKGAVISSTTLKRKSATSRIAALFFSATISLGAAQPARSLVVADRNPDAISDYQVDNRAVRRMVDQVVLAVTNQPDPGRAWASLVGPNDKIGIKISAAGGEFFTTHHAVVDAIVDGLVAAGHPRGSIIVWDRSLGGIKEAGYKPGAEGYQLKSIAPREGYDAKAVLSAPVLGKLVWGDFEFNPNLGKTIPLSDTENTSNVSHFSKIIANEVTKIINVPVMSNSETNGMAGCLYNVTIPNVDNWRRFAQASPFGMGSIADIYANPVVGPKVVLNIMDGVVAEYGGGPKAQPNFSVQHSTIYASKDGVALDALALRRIGQWRARRNLPPIGPRGDYIETAAQMGLGNAAPDRIEIRDIGQPADRE
jgi:uncharacterized protein (DUF362 family)